MKIASETRAVRQHNHDENTAGFFTIGMAGMILVFILLHWSRFAFARCGLKARHSGFLGIPTRVSRRARRLLLLQVPGFTSAGHAIVFLGYIATCITISFVKIDWSSLSPWAKRLGWVAVSNLAFITFLSLKNTPLGILTGYSYERLNVLHQLAGYCTVIWSVVHGIVFITAAAKSDNLYRFQNGDHVTGIIGGLAMLIILGTAVFLRKPRYELFYLVHIVMFVLLLIVVGLHQPKLSTKTLIIVIFAASIWVLDRTLRFLKISLFDFGNTATITPLQWGGTRVVLRRSPSRATPGSHCFLWIPGIRKAETHPFTVVSTNPLEFVIAACDGFTRDLHSFALKHPGKSLRASIDGPYGSAPYFTGATKVLFIAGGSGASFSLGVAASLVHKLGASTNTAIEIIWIVREPEIIQWYAAELEILNNSPLVTLHIYATHNTSSPNTPFSSSSAYTLHDSEKPSKSESSVSQGDPTNYDIEKQPEAEHHDSGPLAIIRQGRPNIAHLIPEVVAREDSNARIAVAACGPESLMHITRKTVAECITVDGPSLELHCEQFGF